MKKLFLMLVVCGISCHAYAQVYPPNTVPSYQDDPVLTAKKQLRVLNDAKTGAAPLVTTATAAAPTVTATKTLVSTTTGGTIPAGTILVVLYVGTGATVTIDGIPLPAGTSIFYPPSSKLHAAITYTVSGGSLYGYYEN